MVDWVQNTQLTNFPNFLCSQPVRIATGWRLTLRSWLCRPRPLLVLCLPPIRVTCHQSMVRPIKTGSGLKASGLNYTRELHIVSMFLFLTLLGTAVHHMFSVAATSLVLAERKHKAREAWWPSGCDFYFLCFLC